MEPNINNIPTLKFYKQHKNIILPEMGTTHAACFDIYTGFSGKSSYKVYSPYNTSYDRNFSVGVGNNAEAVLSAIVMPNERALIPTGLHLDIPIGYSVRVHSRSGVSIKQGLTLINSEGIIDSDYVDELFIPVINLTDRSITIEDNIRLVQGELVKSLEYRMESVTEIPVYKTDRVGGFGSTGTSSGDKSSNKKRDASK